MRNLIINRDLHAALHMIRAAAVSGESLAIDLETTGLSPWRDKIAVVGLSLQSLNEAVILHYPARLGDPGWHDDPRILETGLVKALSDPRLRLVAHNAVGFDAYFLLEAGMDIYMPTWYDTLVGEGVCVKSARRDVRVSLGHAYKRRLGTNFKADIDHKTWLLPTLSDEQIGYVANDIQHLPRLRESQLKEVADDSRARAMETEQAVVPIIMQMTANGIPVDVRGLMAYGEEMAKRLITQLAHIKVITGMDHLNVNSPAQVIEAFNKLGVPVPHTQAIYLATLKHQHDREEVRALAEAVLAARAASKRKGMYSDAWFQKYAHNVKDHDVVRCRYWQVGTDTGRFACSDPNMQQVAADARTFFGRVSGHMCLTADYKALEVAIAAWLAHDEGLLAACRSEDVHRSVAAQLYGVPETEVTADQRRLAKAGTFTYLFGGTYKLFHANAVAQGSSLTLEESRENEQLFFSRFTGLAQAKAAAYEAAKRRRGISIQMPHGLIRHLFNETLRPTTIMNTCVQGGAASGLKYALIELKAAGFAPYLRGSVHDEFVFVMPESMDLIAAAVSIREAMIKGMKRAFPGEQFGHDIPVDVTVTTLPHWKGDAPITTDAGLTKKSGLQKGGRHEAVL